LSPGDFSFSSKKDFIVDFMVRNNAFAYVDSDRVYVHPDCHHNIDTADGSITMNTRRMIAHEMGHAIMSAPVENFQREYRMINIRENENPIMEFFGEPQRLRYESK
jgi:hypothetical protein